MNLKNIYFLLVSLFIFTSCQKKESPLHNSTSIYLRDHANDPVEWQTWTDDLWKKAEAENKLVLVSIGYSACHWCHVMQKESFQNDSVAKIMNQYYVSVKVDREQQPNIDAFYAAEQERITGWAGWPMHVILNPQKEIIWTGIYLKPDAWKDLLKTIAVEYKKDSTFRKLERKNPYKVSQKSSQSFYIPAIYQLCDTVDGGLKPTHYQRKYPNINLLNYLLDYYVYTKDKRIGAFLKKTATKMALGGINDQLEGGFFRFSIDNYWHIPHFEKMLYTNAQMIDFYAKAYKVFGNQLYKKTAIKTTEFLLQKFQSQHTLFYSAMDADQEFEGSYYVFTTKELSLTLEKEYEIAQKYYLIYPEWLWNLHFHLIATNEDSIFAAENNISLENWTQQKQLINKKLLKLRNSKQKPRLDKKMLTSWNALVISGLASVYSITLDEKYLEKAIQMASFFNQQTQEGTELKHVYAESENTPNNVFAEDYLYLANAYKDLYAVSFNERYIETAFQIFKKYKAKKAKMNVFPADDRVMPSALAIENKLAHFFNVVYQKSEFKKESPDSSKISINPERFGTHLANVYYEQMPEYQLIANGLAEPKHLIAKMPYLPGLYVFIQTKKSNLPILNTIKTTENNPQFYLCTDGYCMKPTGKFDQILEILKK